MRDLVTGNPGFGGPVPRRPAAEHQRYDARQSIRSGFGFDPGRAGVATHSIIAVSGNKPLAEDDDGIVKYESAHLTDAQSELIIHSGHSVQGHPLAIAEVRRILYRHGQDACHSANLCGASDNR
jgi:hypothetical protein